MNSPENERPHLIGGPDCFFCNAAPFGRLPTRPPYEPGELLKRLVRQGAQLRIQDAKKMGRTVHVSRLSGLGPPSDTDQAPAHNEGAGENSQA